MMALHCGSAKCEMQSLYRADPPHKIHAIMRSTRQDAGDAIRGLFDLHDKMKCNKKIRRRRWVEECTQHRSAAGIDDRNRLKNNQFLSSIEKKVAARDKIPYHGK